MSNSYLNGARADLAKYRRLFNESSQPVWDIVCALGHYVNSLEVVELSPSASREGGRSAEKSTAAVPQPSAVASPLQLGEPLPLLLAEESWGPLAVGVFVPDSVSRRGGLP